VTGRPPNGARGADPAIAEEVPAIHAMIGEGRSIIITSIFSLPVTTT
jgi:hypothetical protein